MDLEKDENFLDDLKVASYRTCYVLLLVVKPSGVAVWGRISTALTVSSPDSNSLNLNCMGP